MVNALILAAGKINYTLLPVTSSNSASLIPVNGKPVISHIISDMIDRGIKAITIVVRKDDKALDQFVTNMFSKRISLTVIKVDSKNILFSFQKGLETISSKDKLLVVLGDTLIKDKLRFLDTTFVCTGKVNESSRWCLVDIKDDIVVKYYDKIQEKPGNKQALAGYYYFSRVNLLKKAVDIAISQATTQMSDCLQQLSTTDPIYEMPVNKWFDFGNIDNLIESKRKLTQSRYFNSIKINPSAVTLTKTSTNKEKITHEVEWYQSLPQSLQPYTPRLFGFKSNSKTSSVTLEYYGYPTLAELLLYGNLSVDSWQVILNRVINVHKHFLQYRGQCSRSHIESIYIEKTKNRIDSINNKSKIYKIISAETLLCNGEKLVGIHKMLPLINKYVKNRRFQYAGSVIHGDFCLGNILFDYNNQILKLIDPRGSFGKRGIYGDPRYDLAKLRHSFNGKYDFILAGMYRLDAKSFFKIDFEIFAHKQIDKILSILDDKILDLGYNLSDIKLIEGLLFVSMIPLHSEDINRQIMLYLQGIYILNKVLL